MDWVWVIFGAALLLAAVGSWWTLTDRVGRIERKLNALLRHHGVDPTRGLPLSDRVKQLADDPARKIEAIKVYREETGEGLAEAKEAVEAYIHGK
jgi:Ribosomal protein L7/L12 C-terminal domain